MIPDSASSPQQEQSDASSDDLLDIRSEVSEGNESREDWSEEDGSESSYMVDRDDSSESEV